MKENLTQKNLIISVIVVVLAIGGFYYKKAQAPAEIPTPPNLPLPASPELQRGESGEAGQIPPDKGELKGVASAPTLTYDQYLQQGIEYETKGRLLDALKAYGKASEVSPKEYVPYSNAGSAYYSMRKFVEAEDHFLKALELSPSSVSVYTKLYEVYFYGLKRDAEQMKTFFQDALKNTNNDINMVKLYTLYLEEIKDFESALTIWQSLLEFEPDNASYKIKVEALQKKINP
ncbi:MAG: tetratricopeptide repeat protein [Patescibacteria group bacterium]